MHDIICNIIGKTDNIEEKVEILLNHTPLLPLHENSFLFNSFHFMIHNFLSLLDFRD